METSPTITSLAPNLNQPSTYGETRQTAGQTNLSWHEMKLHRPQKLSVQIMDYLQRNRYI